MRKFLWLLLMVPGARVAAQELTVQKIMQDPKWIGASPSGLFWSPDSKTVYFDWNPDGHASDSAYGTTVTGSHSPARVGYLFSREMRAESEGAYNSKRAQMVYSYKGDIYLLDVKSGQKVRITQTEADEEAPRFVRHDSWIVYQVMGNLFAWDIVHGQTLQLTNFVTGAGKSPEKKLSAQDQWLLQEQMDWMQVVKERKKKRDDRAAYIRIERDADTLKDIHVGDRSVIDLAISPDGRFVTYNLEEEAVGNKATVVPQYVNESGYTADLHGRNKVGETLGKTTFYVYDRVKDTVIELKTESIPGITDQPDYVKYYPEKFKTGKGVRELRVNGPDWNEDGSAAIVDLRSHDNKDRWIMQLDPETGHLQLLDRQRDEAWIGGPGIGWFEGGNTGWINDHTCWFQSEASGYSHIYAYDLRQKQKRALTGGEYEVQRAVLSNDKRFFYVLTNQEHPGKQNWYRLDAEKGTTEKITGKDGQYEVSVSPDQHWIAYRYSYINKPWELYLQENLPGKTPVRITDKGASEAFSAYPWRDTRIFQVKARDGKLIYARIYEPAPGKKNGAAVIFVHGAGYLQNVHYGWSSYFREYMFNNLLADKGYTVLDIDYRASSGYGRDWRTGIYRHMGGKDLDDEVDAARYLVHEQGIDSSRIGMYGGSYGGFMTLMALFTKPGVFAAGAALRSVTDWAHYNHGYTAAILNEPYNDSLAYRRSSPIYFAAGLKDHLLICHGMVDENVHFQDDVRLAQRLIELGKDNWELAVYPMEDHGFVEPSSWTDEYKRILKLFDSVLLK